jgi:hypothetical protein
VDRCFYRIIRAIEPQLEDFLSGRDLGKPRPATKYEREWAEGVSVYDDLGYAFEKAVKNRLLLGDHIAEVCVPLDGSVEFKQTTRDRHHFTIYGPARELLGRVRGRAVPVPRAEEG